MPASPSGSSNQLRIVYSSAKHLRALRQDVHRGDDMDEEESLVCHLPNNPETTKSEDSKGYQASEALGISRNSTQLNELNVPIEPNIEYTRNGQSY